MLLGGKFQSILAPILLRCNGKNKGHGKIPPPFYLPCQVINSPQDDLQRRPACIKLDSLIEPENRYRFHTKSTEEKSGGVDCS